MYNGNMKNQLPRKYKITCRVRPLDAPENLVSSRYVGMHYGDADDSRRVCRSDAPENIVSLRYVGMHNGDAGDIKTAETLVLSGFAGGGGLLSKPRAAFHPIAHPATVRHPAAVSLRTKKSRCLAGSQTKKRHKLKLVK